MQQFAIVASVVVSAEAYSGRMTLGGTAVGATCEYANTVNGGLKSPAATSPYISSGRHCAADLSKFAGGAGCGACFKISHNGHDGTDPSRAGSEIVQVVNSADAVDFSCNPVVFNTITGATTGIFPITYEPVACETTSDFGAATVLDGNNAYYTKAIFSDLPHAVSKATLMVGSKSFAMQRVGGATFMASTDGRTDAASFQLTLADGSTNKISPCFGTWPVATGSACHRMYESVVTSTHDEAAKSVPDCQGGRVRVTQEDGYYSQCVDCDSKKFQEECPYWNLVFQKAADDMCQSTCAKAPPPQPTREPIACQPDCDNGRTCVVQADGYWAQCVACEAGSFKKECGYWSEKIRSVAEVTCSKTCSSGNFLA